MEGLGGAAGEEEEVELGGWGVGDCAEKVGEGGRKSASAIFQLVTSHRLHEGDPLREWRKRRRQTHYHAAD